MKISALDLAAKASSLVMSKAIGAAARLIGIVLLARFLSKEDFGITSFVLVSYVTVSALVSIGLADCVYYFYGKYPDLKRFVYQRISRLLFVLAGLGGLVLAAVAYVGGRLGYEATAMFIPMIALLFLDLPVSPATHALISEGRAKLAAVLNAGLSVMLLGAMVIPPILGFPKEAIAYAFLVYGAARTSLFTYFYRRHIPPDTSPPPQVGLIGELIRYAVPIGIANVTWKLNQVVDKYVVMFFVPVAIFAEYSAGSWEFPVVSIIANSTALVMMSELIRRHLDKNPKDVADLWRRSVEKISLLVLPAMVLMILVSKELIVSLFSESYTGAWIVFAVYSLSLLQRVCDMGMLLRAVNATPVVTRWALYTLSLNFLLSVPLVYWLGMVGAAVATVCANVATWFYALTRASKVLTVAPGALFPFRTYAQVLTAAVASAVPVVLLEAMLSANVALALVQKSILYLATFLTVSTIFGVCSKNDWVFVGRLVGFRLRPGY